mmetsp:Transcript_1239/g.5038  ORF Transcript_1239/g.5038 Transcript_1239/m.5038 type:complete len:90 (+) Transcript_1239:1197-1466(+)
MAEAGPQPATEMEGENWENKALVMWNEQRLAWRKKKGERKSKAPRRPVISVDTTYEDMLTTNVPFPQNVPLPEMVDFLVDVWDEDGLYS